jgi:hypothetical protein
MKRKLLLSGALAAGLLCLRAVVAQAAVTRIAFDPPFPTSRDPIHVTIAGQAPLCSLSLTVAQTSPSTYHLGVSPCPVDPPPPDVPYAQTATLGPLPEGSYRIEVDGGLADALTVSDHPGISLVDSLFFSRQRFEASLTWRTAIASGIGVPEAITDNAGYFWFFDSSNPELLVKVIDGRPVNGHFWVFLAGLSDVDYTLTITDRATDKVRTYSNSQGTVASRADTSAF